LQGTSARHNGIGPGEMRSGLIAWQAEGFFGISWRSLAAGRVCLAGGVTLPCTRSNSRPPDAGTVARLADTTWTAAALQLWPRPVQDAVLREQAARLVARYRRDPHFTGGVTWWRAGQIGRLPVDQRDIVLDASATVAAEEYQTNLELTAFDAFGEDDLHGDQRQQRGPPRGPPQPTRGEVWWVNSDPPVGAELEFRLIGPSSVRR
jgi:hypothetical protein